MDLVTFLTRHRDIRQLVISRVTLRDKRSLMRVCKTLYWFVKQYVTVNVMPNFFGSELRTCFCGSMSKHDPQPVESFEKDVTYFECAYGHRSISHMWYHYDDVNVNCGKCGMHAVEIGTPTDDKECQGRRKRIRLVTYYRQEDGTVLKDSVGEWVDEKLVLKFGLGAETDDFWSRVE